MLNIPCPSCAAPVTFVSKVTVFAVCSSCKSTLLRTDLKLEHLGQMAWLNNDWSILQLRTGGTYKGKKFELIGRVQLSWEAGAWNEWYMYTDGFTEGWLAEAQGFYMVSFPIQTPADLPDQQALSAGSTVFLEKIEYKVDDIKSVKCTFSQGELPFRADFGKVITSVDLQGENGRFASISYDEGHARVYCGYYMDFDDLKFSNLKQIDGW